MEAADSLFGPDSGSDPFGALLGTTEQTTETSHENAPPSQPAPGDSAGYFDSYAEATTQDSQAWSGAQQGAGQYASAGDANSAGQGYYQDQNGYGQYGQWNGSQHQSSGAAHTAPASTYEPSHYAPAHATTTPSSYPAHSYDPYTPPTASAKVTTGSAYVNGSPAPVTSTYAPYAPASQYTPAPAAAATPSAYSPYTPSSAYTPAAASQPAPQSYGSYNSAYANPVYASKSAVPPPVPTAPARSAAAAEAYRPKSLNAYDPPIPAARPSKRASSVVPPTPSTYGGYTTATPPPPPPIARYGSPMTAGYHAPTPPPPTSSQFGRPPSRAVAPTPPPPTPSQFGRPLSRAVAPTPPPPPPAPEFGRSQNIVASAPGQPPPHNNGHYAPVDSTYSPISSPYAPPVALHGSPAQLPPPPVHSHYPAPPPTRAAVPLPPQKQPVADPHSHQANGHVAHAPVLDEYKSPTVEVNGWPQSTAETTPAGDVTAAFDYDPESSSTDFFDGSAPESQAEAAQISPVLENLVSHSTDPAVAETTAYGASPYDSAHQTPDMASELDPEATAEDPEDALDTTFTASQSYDPYPEPLTAIPVSTVTKPTESTKPAVYNAYKPNGTSPYGMSPVSRSHSPALSLTGSTHSPYAPPLKSVQSPPPQPKSPASTQSSVGSQRGSLDAIRRPGSRVGSPALSSSAVSPTSYDPYKPGVSAANFAAQYGQQRVASPSAMSVKSQADNTYAPPPPASSYTPAAARDRSMSNVSYASTSASVDPYAPNQYSASHTRRETSEMSDYGDYSSRYGHPESDKTVSYEHSPVQEVTLAPPVYGAYAPSPTLLGANDPLGRSTARVPVISFGAGGRMVTCFHGSGTMNTGFDVALAARQSTDVQIRVLERVVPKSALDVSDAEFPGPLFNDPGTPTTSLVGAGAAAKTKVKKAKVVQYLEDRAKEISAGLGYLSAGSMDQRHAEGKLVLVRLLKVMVENDGRLSGKATADAGVRAALVPRLAATLGETETFTEPAALGYLGLPAVAGGVQEAPLAVYEVRPSSLDKLQDFLIRGDRRKACHYASDEKMWAHAMVIASSIDKDAWRDVVNDFVRHELGVREEQANGREPLRVAYGLFAGQGAKAVEELLPPNLLTKQLGQTLQPGPLQVPAMPHLTPMSPNFPQLDKTAKVPAESLAKWPETAAMLATSPMTPDSAAALTTLGDYLISNNWVEAAHACYLLSGQSHLIGGARAPSARIVLLGSQSPHVMLNFHKDPDPIIFSEIAEFAMSLTAPVKGQEPFHGWPHLQPYRLLRAHQLAELGHIQTAHRYCEAIGNSLVRPSPYLNTMFAEQLKGLHDRLTAAPQLGKGGSWIGGKMSKPSLDSIGNWLEGRFTKFIAGEGENSPAPTVDGPEKVFDGPFSHYSTISSAVPSTSSSPQPSLMNYHVLPNSPLPAQRPGSAMSGYSPAIPQLQVERAASAMDYTRHRASPAPQQMNRGLSANAATTTFAQAESHQEPGSWWASSYSTDSSAPTPTATSFGAGGGEGPASEEGFISLMDTPGSPMPDASAFTSSSRSKYSAPEEDDDDLGLGNNLSKKNRHNTEDGGEKSEGSTPTQEKKAEPPKAAAPASTNTPPAGSGWLSRWWGKKEAAPPGPVKANLGEEVSFYYDKELKKWVNKKAGGADAAKPAAPPPPPSRSQTASPGMMRGGPPKPGPPAPSQTPPPPRAASSIDLTVSPPTRKGPPSRLRSELIPPEPLAEAAVMSAPNTPAAHSALNAPPPPMRPRSQASKRNVRSRYVDVFSQPGQ